MTRFTVVAVLGGLLPLAAQADQVSPPCNTSADLVRLADPLSRVGRRLVSGEPITIVAIGSSSTAGAGASTPANSYPSRLEVELKGHLRGHAITVINRGVNGEEIGDMLSRFDESVAAAKPDLVLWQLGTNSVLRGRDLKAHKRLIRAGLKRVRALGADVVLINPQYAPRVLAKAEGTQTMLTLLASVAKEEKVDLFRRYEVMKRWHEVDRLGFNTFVADDGLHHNDWSYACLARGLGQAIAEAAQRPVISASTSGLTPDWYP